MRAFILALSFLLPSVVQAACSGTDLRRSLTPEEQATVNADLADMPYPEGNHWIARKDGKTLHVVGTMHISDPRMDQVVSRLTPLIEKADSVLFEITVADMTAFQKGLANDMSPVLLTSGPTLIDMMSPEAWDRLTEYGPSSGFPPWMMAKMRPWFLSFALAMPSCLSFGQGKISNGLDHRLSAVATQNDIPQISLETMQDVINLFEKDTLEEQVRLLEVSLNALKMGEDGLETALTLYFEEAHAQAMSISKIDFHRRMQLSHDEEAELWTNFEDDLLKHRNLAWLPGILNQPGDLNVVAVGAAHLSGEFGVLNLLESNGFSLERSTF